jgi:hypothetical protein
MWQYSYCWQIGTCFPLLQFEAELPIAIPMPQSL